GGAPFRRLEVEAMDPRLQLRVQRYGWDRAEPVYERFWARQLAPAQHEMLALADLALGERVLDVACGTGLVTFPAAERVGEGGEVLGVDLSEAMVRRGTIEAEARGLRHVRFERRNAEALELDDGHFDAALCGLGLMYFPDPHRATAEMRRVV